MFAYSIFIDLQKTFDTLNHNILVHKLDHQGTRDLPNKQFQSFLSGRTQYTSTKNKSSSKLSITHGFSQGSMLVPFLYINDLNKAIMHSAVHQSANDTNLLCSNKSLKKINKYTLKHLCQWLRSSKISLNASKTDMITFKYKPTVITKHLNFRVSGQKIKTLV